jgi:uncharacterized protein YggE
MERLLTVSATATREIPVERAEWQLAVRVVDPSPREAFARCTEKLNALAETLRGAGDVTTGRVAVDVDPQRRRGEAHHRQIAYATLTVAGPVERAGELAEAAMNAGADEISGPQLSAADADALDDALLAEAVRAARRRAEAMAAAAGRRLGGAVALSDGTVMRDAEYGPLGWTAAAAAGGPEVAPRPRTVRATVQAAFELLDAPAD